MSESNSKRERGRSSEDQKRDKAMYLYLLESLTDINLSKEKDPPDESSIAKQWGIKNNRIFIQRVLRSTLPEYYDEAEKAKVHSVPGLTLNRLVKILAALEDYWLKKRAEATGNEIPRILTRAEKLKALNKFSQLSFDEREKIDLSVTLAESLHQHLFEVITHPVTGISNRELVPLYKSIINVYRLLKQKDSGQDYDSWDEYIEIRDKFIKKVINSLIQRKYSEISDKFKKQKDAQIKNISKKVKREINRIEFQSGLKGFKSTTEKPILGQTENDLQLLPFSFIENLTRAVVENQILTDSFPIYIQHFEIEKTKPLPLYVNDQEDNGLLNSLILNKNDDCEELKGLETQFAYKVRVHFRVEFNEDYQPIFPDEFNSTKSRSNNRQIIEFFEEVSGIGSVLSLIIAAINKLLLWDIPILKDYFPVAQEILSQDEPICENVQWPVFSSALVKLCRKDNIEKAVAKEKNYEQVAEYQEISYGEYCGFDLVETAAKAALYARLRAIKQNGVNPIKYLNELGNKIEELNALRKAKEYLSLYPFSLKAMEGYLNNTILGKYRKYKTHNNNYEFDDFYLKENKSWSLVAYDAHLSLAKAYLQEGLYRIGKKFLDAVEPHLENEKFNKSNGLILAKYELCQFRYSYLTDLEYQKKEHPDRLSAIRNALLRLEKANNYLQERLKKYHVINQLSQSNFHPFYYLLSRVYSHEAKICTFFPVEYNIIKSERTKPLLDAIRLFEQARIYAARDGDATHYAYWTAYQSWCYFIIAYLGYDYQFPQYLSSEKCLSWSERLINHALVCYSETGKLCYQQIKDNGGNTTSCYRGSKFYEQYGSNKIAVIPLIQELQENTNNHKQDYDLKKNVLNCDLSILKSIEESKYLFGTSSSMIIFSMGMLELCKEQKDNQELIKGISKAIKLFTYSSLIADDGSEHNSKLSTGKELYIDRIFSNNQKRKDDSYLLGGLYPHRISQFADFGKIFIATCKAILILSQDSKHSWEDIWDLLDRLHQLSSSDTAYVLEQERYNGHLARHFKEATRYFKQLKEEQRIYAELELIDIRNKIVKNIFKIMRDDKYE